MTWFAATVGAGFFAFLVWFAFTNPFGFDGYLAEPGCDWGSSHCEQEDYRAMCHEYDGSILDARWKQYCEGER